MPIVQIRDLTKIYIRDVIGTEFGQLKIRLKNRKVAALQSLTLDVEEGQIFGLLGPNGAGKTTAIKILMGLIFPTSGSATLMGKPLGDKSVKSKIGFLPENPYFYDYLKGYEFLSYYGQLYGMSAGERKKKIPELLERVGLSHAADLPLKGYSKGMLQRIGLAQALLNDPRIVFLDEPQSGLDPFGRKEVRDLILSLKEKGATVFFSSHILSDAEMICDRVAILNKGRLINVGALEDILSTRIKTYEIEAADMADELVRDMEAKSNLTLRRKQSVLFSMENQDQAIGMVKKIIDSGGNLVSFIPRRETLEEYFFRKIESKTSDHRTEIDRSSKSSSLNKQEDVNG
ncbi:ABC transporter ATP-binding protein [Candidatus Sumerlaeota bacterium]|nr:ABC transporter ATP-binding protein [Candidatus Sumerlaeota bacterium]